MITSWENITKRISHHLLNYARLMRLDKPIGTLLLLWPTWWALWLSSQGTPSLKLLGIFSLGVFLMRSAGDVINDIADRNFDAHVQRTANRPLATKAISVTHARVLFIVLIAAAALLLPFLNQLTQLLALVGLFLAILYPYTKRFTHWPQIVLGLAYNWAIIMAYAAQLGYIPAQAWILYVLGILWTVAYDTEYALVDKPDDLKIGIKSTAIILGQHVVPVIAALLGLVWSGFLVLGLFTHMGIFYYLCLAIALALLLRQLHLIRHENPSDCFIAFKQNHWFGMTLWLGILLGIPS